MGLEEGGLTKERPFGKRLREEIDRLGLSYNQFGALVAENERPPRPRPYMKNNVEHWVSSRRKPSPYAWLAIERVTGKPLGWFFHQDESETVPPVKVRRRHKPEPHVAAKKREKGSGS